MVNRRPKLLTADRRQLRMVPLDLDAAIPQDDQVRAVWAFVEQLDLSVFYDAIESFEGERGRAAIDPKILFALWVHAILDGIGSARELERLCRSDLRYQWICGGVFPNHHTLSDFRNLSADQLSQVLTETTATLLASGLVEMQRVAQDGVRVRASAGASSFRREHRLRRMLRLASEQVEQLRHEIEHDPGAGKARQKAAAERAAAERESRIRQALEELKEAKSRKRSNNGKKKTPPRASTTDPQARVMKMADGGYRPAYNIQLVTDTATKIVVAVDVTNEGTDLRMMVPLADQVQQRYERLPAEWLADGGYVTIDGIQSMHDRGCTVFAPTKKRRSGRRRNAARPNDPAGVKLWRRRMSSAEAKKIYRERAATAELVNAHLRGRGLQHLLVRGVEKIRAVALLQAITHNFARMYALGFV